MEDPHTLESQLAKLREAAAQRFPQLSELIQRLMGDLESSVIANTPDVGDRAPDFELSDAENDATVRLSAALEDGPVVLSFYRGQW